EEKRLTMRWRGKEIVNLSRDFLNSNGASRQADAHVRAPKPRERRAADWRALVSDLNVCSRRGLAERFDSTIGAGTVLMPFGGARQKTPAQAMAARIPLLHGSTRTCSAMAYGFNPFLAEESPYHGAYAAVIESVARLVASGAG